MKTRKELKSYLKNIAQEIRTAKDSRKKVPYGYVAGLDSLRYNARHHHIAASMLRGRTIEQIEAKTNDSHNSDWVKQIMAPILEEEAKHEEALCNCED